MFTRESCIFTRADPLMYVGLSIIGVKVRGKVMGEGVGFERFETDQGERSCVEGRFFLFLHFLYKHIYGLHTV